MTRSARRLLLPLALVAALVGLTVLAPTGGGTHALWSASEAIAVGEITNDSLGLSMTAPKSVTEIPGSTTLTLTNESARLDGTVDQLQGSASIDGEAVPDLPLNYLMGGSPVEDFVLEPRQGREVELEVTPEELRTLQLSHAGRTIDVTTTATQESGDATSWTGSATAKTEHHVSFPRPTHPGGGELTSEKVCDGQLIGRGTIMWAWPDSDGDDQYPSPAVDQWTVEVLKSSGWEEVQSVRGDLRSARVSVSYLLGVGTSAWFRVVAHPEAGNGPEYGATFMIEMKQAINLLGIPVGVTCGAVTAIK